MDFSESQLVDLVWDGYPDIRSFCPLARRYPGRLLGITKYKLLKHREFALQSGRRIDLLRASKCGRFNHIIEFKIVADTSAIIQAVEYAEEICRHDGFHFTAITIVAQFFHPDCLFFAENMGIQCLHISPINRDSYRMEELILFDPHKVNTWASFAHWGARRG